MIKSVSIQNFEAHEDTTIEFGEGMNSIVGLSNSGKSAIIRALMVVVDNEWSKEMVRTGFEFCRVKVETERGWVEAERGEKVNRWRCQEGNGEIQFYQKVGTTVPELATKILGMGKRERGGGISELPNFQTQLEKHYMLAEVGEKKATSNMIAVMMDNAIGLGGMEDLIKDFSSDLLTDRKWLTKKQEEISDLKTLILDEKIFNSYENEVAEIGRLQKEVEELDSELSIAESFLSRYDTAKSRKDAANTRLAAFPDCDGLEGKLEDVERLGKTVAIMEKVKELESRLADAKKISGVETAGIENGLEEYGKVCSLLEKCERVKEKEERLARQSVVSGIECEKFQVLESSIDDIDEKISRAEESLSNARDLWKRHQAAKKQENALVEELSKAEKEFEDLKKELGVCPLCGNKL